MIHVCRLSEQWEGTKTEERMKGICFALISVLVTEGGGETDAMIASVGSELREFTIPQTCVQFFLYRTLSKQFTSGCLRRDRIPERRYVKARSGLLCAKRREGRVQNRKEAVTNR